jgi:TolB-like protein
MFETLGHYKILDRIGAGGMGEVYRARDTRLGRTVAIKVLAAGVANDPERRDRFLREARATAALSHPNIAALYEIGEDQGQLFLVFEFVPGETLKTEIGGQPLNPRRAIDLAVQIADALADAHAEGIVHRDIKPANIIVTPKDKAKVLDFGLATWTAGGAERDHAANEATVMVTSPGTALGTVAYMSPEQALGEKVDHRTDVFSLGIVLFEMLTGKPPFGGATSTALALQIVQASAPAPSAVNRSLPPELDAIINKMLAKSIEQRYESAVTLAAELRSIGAILDVRSDFAAPEATLPRDAPRGRAIGRWLMLLLVLGGLAGAAWLERDALKKLWRHTIGPPPSPVIAVVPFDTDASQTFFADGLAEDLITRLGQTPGLKVIGRSATRQYRGRAPRDVARELGAAVVLTGSVRPSADSVKVSLELVDPTDDTAVWSQQYTREVRDIFAVQAQVAEAVATALRVKLQPTGSSARAASRLVDPRAYETYLRARQATDERRLDAAIKLYQDAIAADAGLAEAYAGLAVAMHLDMVFNGDAQELARLDQMKAAAERASQLDPDLPSANVALGLTAPTLAQSLQFMRHAVDVDPTYGDGYRQIADQVGEFDVPLAMTFWRKSLAVDPRLEVNHVDLTGALTFLNRWGEARQELALVRSEGFGGLKARVLAFIDLDEHKFDSALQTMRSNPMLRQAEPVWSAYVVALATADRFDAALAEALQGFSRFPDSCAMRSALAGLRLLRGQTAVARQLAGPLFEAAAGESANPAAVRCAVTTAAAMKDGPRVAALLDRIAAHEDLLRFWVLPINGMTGGVLLRGRQYPFMSIVTEPVVMAARKRLDEAQQRLRDAARVALAGLP